MTSYANSFCKNVTAKDIQLDYLTALLKSYIISDDHSSSIKCKYVPLQLRTLLVKELQFGVDEQKIQYLGGLCSYIEKSAKEQLFYQKIVGIVGDYICTNMIQIQHPLVVSFKQEYLTETSKLSQDDVKFYIARYNYYRNCDLQEISLFSSIFNPGTPLPSDSILKRSMCNMGWKLVIVFVKFAAQSVFDNLDDSDGENLHRQLIAQQADSLAKQRTNIEALLDETLSNNPLRMESEETCFTDEDASTIVETEFNEQNSTSDKKSFIDEKVVTIHENISNEKEYDYIGERHDFVDSHLSTDVDLDLNLNVKSNMNTHVDQDLKLQVESDLSTDIDLNINLHVEPDLILDANIESEAELNLHPCSDTLSVFQLISDEYFEQECDDDEKYTLTF